MSSDTNSGGNPLSKFFRQPAIYVGLPSGGRFWADGALNMPENQELPVYPMTSKDEITLRTPDALLNGQGVVDVIQSCMPNIRDAWKIPSVDVDSILISLRIASYGHSMDFDNTCPHCKEQHTYGMDLRQLMGGIRCPDYDEPVRASRLEIRFRPQNYFEVNKTNQINFETAKLNEAIAQLPDSDEKVGQAMMQLERLIGLNQEVMAGSTDSITLTDTGTVVDDHQFILEFYQNIDAKLFNEIQQKLLEKNEVSSIKPVPVTCPSCEGLINLTILFDYANFFVVGS
jgi:hypothetical protein